MKVGQSNTYADQACRPMTTTRTRTGKNCRPAADPSDPQNIREKKRYIADAICLRKRNVPKICASTTGYLVFLRRSADCFTDKKRKRKNPAPNMYVPDSPTSRREPEGPSRAKPQTRNIYIERHPSNAPARPYPKGPTGYRLHSFLPSEGSSGPEFLGGIVLPTFRTDSSKRRNAPGGRRRARGWWRRCGRSWLLLRVRGCTTQHKRRNGRYKRTGSERDGGGTAELYLPCWIGS